MRILIVDDERMIREVLREYILYGGYEAVEASNGEEAVQLCRQMEFDVVLMDVMMPKMDGFELTKVIRESGSMLPIIMLTAKALPEDKRTGFLVGTDDYMVKPPDRQELILRIKALLRRARIVDEHKITIGEVVLDYDTHTVRRGYDAQVLPPKEFNLLYKLLAYPERTFTRLELLDEIWGMDSESDEKTVNVHINRLRTRFMDWPELEIQTIRGMGYRALRKV
jgi:DNA-binding response OmpR family regulator